MNPQRTKVTICDLLLKLISNQMEQVKKTRREQIIEKLVTYAVVEANLSTLATQKLTEMSSWLFKNW